MTLDLIEQVAALRGQVRSMETEWDDIRGQIQKGYQRMEKANQRAERRVGDPDGEVDAHQVVPPLPLHPFAKKLAQMRGR